MPLDAPDVTRTRYDAVVVGGGHNGLAAAAYLAGAGRSVLVVERRDAVGGAVRSERSFAGHDAQLSTYSYLVSLLPEQIVDELGLDIRLERRAISSYTPIGDGGILVDRSDPAATRRALGADADSVAGAVRDHGGGRPTRLPDADRAVALPGGDAPSRR